MKQRHLAVDEVVEEVEDLDLGPEDIEGAGCPRTKHTRTAALR